jgi:hypothetical protein
MVTAGTRLPAHATALGQVMLGARLTPCTPRTGQTTLQDLGRR